MKVCIGCDKETERYCRECGLGYCKKCMPKREHVFCGGRIK